MQGTDKKYDGHAWCKVITTNIKKKFGFNFKKTRCLGHLRCVQDNCENFVHIASHNEMFWFSECTHILVTCQIVVFPSTFAFRANFVMFFLFLSRIIVVSILCCAKTPINLKSSDSS
jgi:hypothetical protein